MRCDYNPKTRILTIWREWDGPDDPTHYTVESLTDTPAVVGPAVRLRRIDGGKPSSEAVYDVAMTEFGVTCSCADETFRHGNTQQHCRHCQAAQDRGLLRRNV